MLPPASIAEIANLADPTFRLTMMRDCVRAVQAPGHLYYPLLNLVTTFIDGLAAGAKGNTRTAYLAYLENHFPNLCAAIGAEKFYTNYRCAAVHEFGLKSGYAIGRDNGLHGKYVDTQTIRETAEVVTILNIDRLVSDFMLHIDQLLAQVHGRKAP